MVWHIGTRILICINATWCILAKLIQWFIMLPRNWIKDVQEISTSNDDCQLWPNVIIFDLHIRKVVDTANQANWLIKRISTYLNKDILLNPFTAQPCTISGPKRARTRLQTVHSPGPITNLLSVLCILIQPFSRVMRKRNQKCFRIWNFTLWLVFSRDIMAVKGLNKTLVVVGPRPR